MNEHKKEKKKDNTARGVDASDFDTSYTIEECVEEVPSKSEKKRKETRKKRENEVREDNEVVNEETLNSFGSEDGTSEKSEEKCESESENTEKKMKKEKKKRKSNEPLGINRSEAQKESELEKSSDFNSSKEITDNFREEKKIKGREKNGKLGASSSLNTSEECSDSRGDEGCGNLVNDNAKGKRQREDDSLESDKYEHRKTKKIKQENKEMKEKTSVAANGEDATTKKKKAAKVGVDQRASKLGNGGDTDNLTTSKSRNNKRRVTFSDKVEVFPADKNTKCKEEEEGEGKLVQGKRFSKEEDELVKKAVEEYIDTNQLGEEGVNMIMNCKRYPQIKNCWRVIGASVPWRPYEAVYQRAHVLFQRSEERKWDPEEYEIIKSICNLDSDIDSAMRSEIGSKVGMEARRFTEGTNVEVLNLKELPSSSWRRAVILSVNEHAYRVKYVVCSSDINPIIERVPRKAVRPCPPRVESPKMWSPGDIVEVFENNSWRLAKVSRVDDEGFLLLGLLGNYREVTAHTSDIRLCQTWVNNRWVVLQKKHRHCNIGTTEAQSGIRSFRNEMSQPCSEFKKSCRDAVNSEEDRDGFVGIRTAFSSTTKKRPGTEGGVGVCKKVRVVERKERFPVMDVPAVASSHKSDSNWADSSGDRYFILGSLKANTSESVNSCSVNNNLKNSADDKDEVSHGLERQPPLCAGKELAAKVHHQEMHACRCTLMLRHLASSGLNSRFPSHQTIPCSF